MNMEEKLRIAHQLEKVNPQIAPEVHRALRSLGRHRARRAPVEEELREWLMGAYERLGPYADALPTLEQLKAAGLRLAILSNGAPRMLEAAGFKPDKRLVRAGAPG